MRDVSSRALDMSLSGGSVRRVRREVRLAMVEECGVPVRLMTMGMMSTSVSGQFEGNLRGGFILHDEGVGILKVVIYTL
jgi:hypothetical protein